MNSNGNDVSTETVTRTTEAINASISGHRSERRIAVQLPLKLRCRDKRGVTMEEDTSSENVCRSGAAFITRVNIEIGADVEILIPFSNRGSRRLTADFESRARVVHVGESPVQGMKLVGVQFTGPRFQRVFRSETA